MSEIPKAYEPQAVEEKWYRFWLEQKCFVADAKSKKPAYSIVIPPPNVTGVLTLGHVLNNTIQDILARKARMDGKEVLWLPGTDHAGIATQTVVERTLKKQGVIKHRDDLGREKFLEKVWEWKEKHGGIIIQQLKKLGASCDWTRERFTMDPEYSRCVQKVFVELYKKGLIYRGKRMVNWCPISLTALSDEEVTMKPQKGVLYYFKVEVAEQPGTWLTIATTRPETIPGDTAVAVNPKDPRYGALIGKHVVRPLPVNLPKEQKLIPIIGDEHIDIEFGTGVLKVTPAHDKADFEIGLRHKLPTVDVMNPDGTMNALAGESLVGLDRFEARAASAERLRELGVLVKEEPYENNVGFSERADVPVEPRLSEQWFLKYPSAEQSRECVEQPEKKSAPGSDKSPGAHHLSEKLASEPIPGAAVHDDASSRVAHRHVSADMLIPTTSSPEQQLAFSSEAGNASNAKMRFFPDRWAKVYDHWMGNLQDWCISRQLWWGHRVPVWYRRNPSPTPAGKHPSTLDDAYAVETYCDIEPPTGDGWLQDPDVLDTWFSSWLWPFATMGWPEKTETLKKFYPTTDLVTGPDIIFFWVARMIMAGYEFMGEMPFRNVYFTGIIRDKQGRKMSKSLGNSPDPLDLIAKFGADALRFGIMRSAPQGQDLLFDEQQVELGRNFCNKLWNACRFRQMQGGESEGEIDPKLLTSDDKWILLRLDKAIREVTTALEEYKFNEAAQTLYRFFWNEYCDWYVEASKAVFFGDNEAQKANKLAVIDFVLTHALRLFHPYLPFITEELWHGMGFQKDLPDDQGGRTIMYARWPKPLDDEFKAHYGMDESDERLANAKYELVTRGRNLRREYNIASNKKVKFVFKPSGNLSPAEAEVIKLLLNADQLEVRQDYAPAKGTPAALSELGELFMPLEGLIDVEAEKARLTKELAKIEAEIQKVEAKLANPAFTEKAPANVLDEHRKRLADWQAKHQQVKTMLADLKG